MSSSDLEVVFEGPALQAGSMDAHLLGESLLGYSELFNRANFLVNGEASATAVLVKSNFRRGSFITDLELIQNIIEEAKHLITAHPFLDATALAGVIGFVLKNRELVQESLIGLYKWLKGGKPDKVVQVGNNVELTLGQSKKTVSKVVLNLYGDSAIRSALGRVTGSLREAGINRISIRQDGAEQAAFDKAEAEYFEPEPLQLESGESPTEGTRETVLIVSKLSFVEGTTWTFFERGATVVAKIEDEEFWSKVHQHKVTFGEGDQLRVILSWHVTPNKSKKLVAKNTITKVKEVMEDPTQLNLDRGER